MPLYPVLSSFLTLQLNSTEFHGQVLELHTEFPLDLLKWHDILSAGAASSLEAAQADNLKSPLFGGYREHEGGS